jgi:hypothetical protein
MAKQINIFIDNKPGKLQAITGVLFKNYINIRAMTIQDKGEYGLMKLLVDNPNKANLALVDQGYAAALKDVLAIIIDDKPGGLHRLATVFLDNNINILDSYGFVVDSNKKAVWCVEVENIDAIRDIVKKERFNILEDQELYEL